MLEIKNVTKEYTANGVTVKALDNVSVTFPEKGLIFLLGKSGSGKSTLLNIAGGLDMPDSGEIILKGKSSKNFSQADFDSYRNTFVGFIFQEYNILNEFSIEDNIALALELQGKQKDEKAVNELLRQVGLEKFGKRKPNTLSGGQKQRVAIARALVKNPEIIMADEPTGALDSATGKQVFDTLKQLSAEKLVVVVSHDREFAEVYADRIIELKDGHVMADRSKVFGDSPVSTENVTFIGEKTLSVKSGSALTQEDVEKIVAFVKSNEKDVVISANEAHVQTTKKAEGVNDLGIKGSFQKTDASSVDNVVYDENQVTFIKSRLPVRHAVKIGTSGLRIKPFKLVFTALLSTVAFIIFGLLSTLLTYNENNIIVNAVSEVGYTVAALQKNADISLTTYGIRFGNVYSGTTKQKLVVNYTDDEISAMNKETDKCTFVGVYNYNNTSIPISENLDNVDESVSYYYYNNYTVNGFCDVNDNLSSLGMTLVAGEYPTNGTEIAISEYLFDLFCATGFQGSAVSSYEDVIGKKLLVTCNDQLTPTVTGIISTGNIPEKYDVLKGVQSMNYFLANGYNVAEMRSLYNEFFNYRANSFDNLLFVNQDFYEENREIATKIAGTFESRISALLGGSPERLYTSEEYEQNKKQIEAEQKSFAVSDYLSSDSEMYAYAYASFVKNFNGGIRTVLSMVNETGENGASNSLNYDLLGSVKEATLVVNTMERIFIVAGCALALFAALLLSNFIAVSINNKEKDIGILRAVGARGIDIFKIFISEALVITLICFALASVGTAVVCTVVNSFMVKKGITAFSILLFNGLDVLFILAISVVTAFVSTFLPVRKAVKKKPVEAIRSL